MLGSISTKSVSLRARATLRFRRSGSGTYFRSWGVYTQGDGAGVVGGTGGEGKATPYFMVRIRIPNGLLRSDQVRAVADIAERHARGVVDITVRQNFQLHWVTLESLPEVLESLWHAGLTTTGACGDVARNITGCPVAGLDAQEIVDASPLALAIDRELGGVAEFYNLPRKFKISITGCKSWCSYPEINDVALTASTRKRRGAIETGFSLRSWRRALNRSAHRFAAERFCSVGSSRARSARGSGNLSREPNTSAE